MLRWYKVWQTMPVLSWIKAAKLYKNSKFEEAVKCYQQGIQKHPKHPAVNCATMDLAYCLFKLERFSEAEKYLSRVVRNMPDSREAHMRLAKLQAWTGNYLEAAWTIKMMLENIPADPEIISMFVGTVIDAGAPNHLLTEAKQYLDGIPSENLSDPMLEVAHARLAIHEGDYDSGKATLASLASQLLAPVEAQLSYAELLLDEGKIEHARRHLQRGLHLSQSNPRLLTLLAKSYLIDGVSQNYGYAKQLAVSATQASGWLNPDAMHILAQSYYKTGDKITALLVASKAKQVGVMRTGVNHSLLGLDQLIKSLSEGTLA